MTAPSGKFIIQLFLVPGFIVVVAVGILWGFSWLIGGARDPNQFLRELNSPNTQVRWRAASDLAQVLKRDQALAANPRFALDLAELLRRALEDYRKTDKRSAERASDLPGAPAEERDAEDRYLQFLINCLGNFTTPAGLPLLREVALRGAGADPGPTQLVRQDAVWALANLGDKTKHLDKTAADLQAGILADLDAEAAGGSERGEWAAATARFMRKRFQGEADAFGVDRVLDECASAGDPNVRKLAAFALNIWDGSPDEAKRMDQTLKRLSYDDGHGGGEEARVRGIEVRYKAAEGLARRGSSLIDKHVMNLLGEMLDEDAQARNFRVRLQDGRDVADDTAVASTVTSALRALGELHRLRPDFDLSRFDEPIQKLGQDPNPYIRSEAEKTVAALGAKRG